MVIKILDYYSKAKEFVHATGEATKKVATFPLEPYYSIITEKKGPSMFRGLFGPVARNIGILATFDTVNYITTGNVPSGNLYHCACLEGILELYAAEKITESVVIPFTESSLWKKTKEKIIGNI